IFGDASSSTLLEEAGIKKASYLLLTMPQSVDKAAIVMAARELNPDLRILVRAHYLAERFELEKAGATAVISEEAEAALALSRIVLEDTGASDDVMEREIRELTIRLQEPPIAFKN